MDTTTIAQMGAIGVIFLFAIKEFFSWLKSSKKGGQKTQNDIDIALLQQDVREIKTNHLSHIEKSLEENKQEHKENRELLILIASQLGIAVPK